MKVEAVTGNEYAELLLASARRALPGWRAVLDAQTSVFYPLWGYNPPAEPLRLAALLSYLRSIGSMGGEASREALAIVRAYAALRDRVSREQIDSRAETRGMERLPLFVNFFLLPPYAEMVARLRESGDLPSSDIRFLESELPAPANALFAHPEWGGHNRTILRADGLCAAAAVLPGAPDAARWRRMAEILAGDNVEHWEIEDASIYHPVWLYFLSRYLERQGRTAGFRCPFLRWYAEYFLQMMAPHGTIPDFGDGEWRGTWLHFTAFYELAARETGDPRYRWAAARHFRSCRRLLDPGPGGAPPVPLELIDAHRWCADWQETRCPEDHSREVLEDSIGKKVVFRTGWQPEDTWLLLDYMDEGSWGWLDRRYLRDTITVEEEKMHHGHSDENGVAMLMSGGSLLLHDAGYRDDLPSGRWGAFRADYFHNRLVARQARLDRGQDLFELLRHSGAYRPVRTLKVDFQRMRHADYSRTRLVDEATGWLWDRVIVFLRDTEQFIVIDGWHALRDDVYTVACLWHTQTIVAQGDGWVAGGYDLLPTRSPTEPPEALPRTRRLLVRFMTAPQGRRTGTFALRRHYGEETAFYQAESSHLLAGRWSAFVTRLVPLAADARLLREGQPPGSGEVVDTDWAEGAVCVRLRSDGTEDIVLVKLDLDRERTSPDIRPRLPYERGAVTAGALRTDAHFAHVRLREGRPSWSATVVSGLAWDGKPLFVPPLNTFGLQPDGAPDRESRARWRMWESDA